MLIRFIAHAGIAIEEDGFRILIDPWFFDSTYDHPVIQSIGSDMHTIDFQIPKTTASIDDYAPHAILVSHFHPHHSAARDISTLAALAAKQATPLTLCYGDTHPSAPEYLENRVPKEVHQLQLRTEESITIGPFTITAKPHPCPFHTTWHITSPSGSLLHTADGRINEDRMSRTLGTAWESMRNLKPDFLFLSSGSHANKIVAKDGSRDISEAGIASPVEAAKITACINPRTVSLIGIYNHSIFKNRQEYILPSYIVEDEFEWALWLAPHIPFVRLRPGSTLGVGDSSIQSLCSYYLHV